MEPGDDKNGLRARAGGLSQRPVPRLRRRFPRTSAAPRATRQGGKIGDGGGAGIAGSAGKDHMGHRGPENLCDLVHGFVSHGSEEQHHGTLAQLLG